MAEQTTQTDAATDGAQTTQADTTAQAAPGGTTSGASAAAISMTREEFDRQLADARRTTEKQVKESQEIKDLRAKAKRAEELEEAGKSEVEKLTDRATKAETALTELQAVREQVTRYEVALKAHLETQRKDLPTHIIPLLDRMDPVDQLEYLASNREALVRPAGGGAAIPGTPRPENPAALSQAEQDRRRALVAQQVRRAL